MTSTAATAEEYLGALPADRKEPMTRLRETIVTNLPEGFSETMAYGILSYAVPHSRYPAGYHVNPKLPLLLASIGSQKNYIVLHHMGLYAMPALLKWFQEEYPKHSKTKLDMGKGCVRFKKPDDIPFGMIGELMKKLTPDAWIECYESVLKKSGKQ